MCPQLVYEVRKALLSPRLADRYDISTGDAEAFSRQLSEEGRLVDDPVGPPLVVPEDARLGPVRRAVVAEVVLQPRHMEGLAHG